MSALEPSLALLLHRPGRPTMGPSDGPMVVSVHGIIEADGGPMLDAGRVLSGFEAANLGAILCKPASASKDEEITLIPTELLRETRQSLCWYRAPTRTKQHWRTQAGRTVIDAVLSGLVFQVVEGTLFVAAYAGGDRPDLATKLYHAPLGNVYDDTRVCVGNAMQPSAWNAETMGAWEHVLLGTNYTHPNHDRTLRARTDTEGLMDFWQRRRRYSTAPDAKFLQPLRMTLGEWIEWCAKEPRQ